jgi:quercetin dioxygenase-like cupin family protein
MKIRKFDNTDWHRDHPSGILVFQYCMVGEPQSPDNFMLVLGRQDGDFHMPRHRHNFDQIRLPLKGDMNIGDGLKLKEGQVGYFPEGLPYGPQDDPLGKTPPGERLQLVLQFGGASGIGFMSMEQRLRARDELARTGEFVGPNYRHPDGKLEWGLNVIWQHVFGERLKYPMPRYPKVVIADPQRFNWIPGAAGVARKFLGSFTEREASVEMVRVKPGALWQSTHDVLRLVFVLSGEGSLNAQRLDAYDTIQVEAGELLELRAGSELELFVMGLPPVTVPGDSEAQFELVDGAADDSV